MRNSNRFPLKPTKHYKIDDMQRFSQRLEAGQLTSEETLLRNKLEQMYNRIPNYMRQYDIGNREARINQMLHAVLLGSPEAHAPARALLESVRYETRSQYGGTARLLYNEMVSNEPLTYNAYRNYVSRMGYAPTRYYYENIEIGHTVGSIVEANVTLPVAINGISYSVLYMKYDFSASEFVQIIMR